MERYSISVNIWEIFGLWILVKTRENWGRSFWYSAFLLTTEIPCLRFFCPFWGRVLHSLILSLDWEIFCHISIRLTQNIQLYQENEAQISQAKTFHLNLREAELFFSQPGGHSTLIKHTIIYHSVPNPRVGDGYNNRRGEQPVRWIVEFYNSSAVPEPCKTSLSDRI